MKRKWLKTAAAICAAAVMMVGFCACDSKVSLDENDVDRFDFDAEKTVPTETQDIAVLQGSWYEMGYQLGEQFPDEVKAATALNVASEVEFWGSYEKAVKAYDPYLELADKWFMNDKDGGLTDMIKGVSESTGMSFNDAMMMFIDANTDKLRTAEDIGEGSATQNGKVTADATDDQRDCSAILAWDKATGTEGVIGAMKADIGYGDLNYVPTLLCFPDHGNAFISTHGVFGSVANEKGFMIQSPGGSVVDRDKTYRVGIFPHMYLAAYCDTTQEAIDVLGDPEKTPVDKWWPTTTDFNMCMGDATGDAVVFEITGTERNLRRCGDDKYISKTKAGDAMVDNETSDYLIAANWYMGENMLFSSRLNSLFGLDEIWPDGLVRYWSEEKILQDNDGEVDIDVIRKAMSSASYYLKEGYTFDCFPDWDYFGTFVPNDIYEGFENGTIKREDYYGDSWTEEWGEPMKGEEVLATKEYSLGWHDNQKEAWSLILDTSYWAPEPYAPEDKTGLINIFDSNTKAMYLLKGSANRAISNIPESTGTFAKIAFADKGAVKGANGDAAKAMLEGMEVELEMQIWEAARDLIKANVDPDSADGAVLYGYLDKAREAIYQAQSYESKGFSAANDNARLKDYSKAMSKYIEGQCYAKLAKKDPQALNVDLGRFEVTEK